MTLFDHTDGPPRRVSLVKLSADLARASAGIGRVSVEGEVVKPQTRPNGRVFFTMRDRAAQISVTVPGSRARHCRTVHGERVCVTGTLTYLPERGQIQLSAEEITPVGAGAIAALLAEVRARLSAEGLLERPRRRLPRLPAKVGVVCGADAAVRGDIESVVAARMPGYPVAFAEVTVSGPGAAESIVAGLASLLADPEVEVVILARGGGDAASLLPFSDEGLCRAIAAAAVPVVVAIGHEGDRPLCDEVADVRAATPSLAAAAVIPSRRDLDEELAAWAERAGLAWAERRRQADLRLASAEPSGALQQAALAAGHRLGRASSQLDLLDPRRRLADARRRLESADRHSAIWHRLGRAGVQLGEHRRTLEALDPRRVLQRGYAVVRGPDGRVLRDPAHTAAGDRLSVLLAGGELAAQVLASGEAGS